MALLLSSFVARNKESNLLDIMFFICWIKQCRYARSVQDNGPANGYCNSMAVQRVRGLDCTISAYWIKKLQPKNLLIQWALGIVIVIIITFQIWIDTIEISTAIS